jgi:hypothetical protein
MKLRRAASAAILALGLCSLPLPAHHAFSAVFDLAKQRDFKGTVSKVEWLNPHAHFLVDVPQTGGKTISWEFELGSPNALMQHGWNRYTLKKGDVVTVTAVLARDGSNYAHARAITFAGGSRICDYDRFNGPDWSCPEK